MKNPNSKFMGRAKTVQKVETNNHNAKMTINIAIFIVDYKYADYKY